MTKKKQRTGLFPLFIFSIISILLFSTIAPVSLSTDPPVVTLTQETSSTLISIETETQDIEPNTDFIATITVHPGQDIAGIQCNLHYNPSLITVVNVTPGNIFTGYDTYFLPGTNNPANGILTGLAGAITTLGGGCINQTGVFAILHLKTLMNPGASFLNLSDVIIGGPTAESLPVTINNTHITIPQDTETTAISITPQKQTLSPNKTYTFSIWVYPTTEIAGVQAQLNFNPAFIKILNITQGSLFGSKTYFHTTPIDNHNGIITSISSVTTAPGGTLQPGALATITYQSLQKTGDTPLTLTNVIIGDFAGNPVPSITQNGSLTISSAGVTQMTITPNHQTVNQGNTVTVDIHIDPQEYVAGVQFDLTFDSSLLTAQSVDSGSFFTGMDSYFNNGKIDNSQGIIQGVAGTVLGDTNSGTINPGTFATITFTAQSKTGESPLGLQHIILGDPEATPLPIALTNGTIEVLSHYTSIFIDPETVSVSPGDTFTLDIMVNPLEAISGVETDILFDPSLLTAVSVHEGDLFTGFNTHFNELYTIDNINGAITDIWGVIADIGGGSTTNPGSFAQITFTAKMAQGTTPITLSEPLIGTPGATPVQLNTYHGMATIGFTLTFSLKTGWNTLSLPFQEMFTAETLGQAIGVSDAIAHWNHETQEYIIHPVGIYGQDFSIEPGQGYLIHVYEDTQFSITGGLITEDLTLPITMGWNLLGWIHDTDTTAEQFGATITGCDAVTIWDPETQDYIIHPQGTEIRNFSIYLGDALFIHTTQDSTWQG